MNSCYKFFPLVLILLYSVAASMFTTTATAASLSPDVRQALDGVYLAAKEADMVHPEGDTKNQANAATSDAKQPPTTSRDPLTQMLAAGLGAAAAMVVVNYLSGGMASYGSFSGFSTLMLGGMMGDYAYRTYYAPPLPGVPADIAQRVSP